MSTIAPVEPHTKRKYRAYIVNDIAPFMGHLPLQAVSQFTDAAWVLHLEEKGNSGKTIANKHGFFASAMAAAARIRPKPLIGYNPCIGTRLPRHDTPEMVFFEPDEYELFLSVMPQRWHAQTEFSLASMARPSEVSALTVGDINRDTGAVRINKAYKYTGTGWRLGPPKTKRGVRTANVPFETLDLLDLDRPHDALLFHTRRGTPIRAAYFYREAFLPSLRGLLVEVDDQGNVVVDRLGGKRPSPYTLRHTGISWRLLGGVPMFVVSRDAGYDSYDTTGRRYGHLDRTASAAATQVPAAKIPRVNNLPEPTT